MINTINIFPKQHALQSSSKLNKVQKTCYVKINWPTLFSKTKRIVQKHNLLSFPSSFFFSFFIIIIKIKYLEWNAWMLCNENPRNKKEKHKNQRTMVTKGKTMKHNNHIRKTQLDRVFCTSKPFSCTTSIGVCIHIRVISNSRIGIKVENLYQFINKCYRILCQLYFLF